MLNLNTDVTAYFELVRESLDLDLSRCQRTVRLALLCDFTSQQLTPVLRVLLARVGLAAEIYEAHFDTTQAEALDPASGLHRFQPEMVVVLSAVNSIRTKYYAATAKTDFVDAMESEVTGIWESIQRHSKALVVQGGWVEPYDRIFGHFDALVPETFVQVVRTLNARVARAAATTFGILFCDLDGLASWFGRRAWFDDKLWVHSKTLCSLALIPQVAASLARICEATFVRTAKCVVLDLDGTLWGGVIGDDGIEGITLSPEGEGEAYLHFQHYLLELKRRGLILAVCSKNEPDTALKAFREHEHMVLKEDDIAVFVANWKNKADNVRHIREILNIGFDSMVFLDDSPFERNLIRTELPDVNVPELPEDPAEYVRAVVEAGLFEATAFSAEDRTRSDMVRQETRRAGIKSSFTNLDDYLESLGMEATVARFTPGQIERTVQLIQRSNQFNLMTRRYNEAQCVALMDSKGYLPFTVNLRDKFGDYGLISVVVLRFPEPTGPGAIEPELAIDEWLMSCRVLSRGVEWLAMNLVFDVARALGLARVTGQYIPTAKNGMVKDFYRQFGFEQVATEEGGATRWQCVTARHVASETKIRASLQGLSVK